MDSQGRADDPSGGPSAFEMLVRERWPRSKGGILGLAREIQSTSETIYSWFRGDNEPNMGHLAGLAKALGVSRAELVAALDGDPYPAPPVDSVEARLRALEAAVALLGLEGAAALQARSALRESAESAGGR